MLLASRKQQQPMLLAWGGSASDCFHQVLQVSKCW